MLSAELVKQDCQTFHAEGDADLLIVQKAVESCLREDTALVGDDTDLLILLVHHIPFQSKNLYFTPEPKKNAKEIKVWNIRELKAGLGPEVCENILFIHAFLGCDTTSRIYGVGKGLLLKKIKTNSKLKQAAKEFYALDANPSHIADAGEEVFKIIYNAKEILQGTGNFMRKLQRVCLTWNHSLFHQLRQLRNITAIEFICKYVTGHLDMVTKTLKTGAGRLTTQNLFLYKQTYRLPQNIY